MRHRFAVLHNIRNDVLAKIMAGMRVCGVFLQQINQEFGLEHINAHRGQRHIRLAGHRRRVFRLFEKGDDPVGFVNVHHAKAGGLFQRHLKAANGDIGLLLNMLLQHLLIVHFIYMVTGEQHYMRWRIRFNNINVLINSIGCAQIPHFLGDALAGGQNVKALVALGPEEVPAALQMADQAVRLILRGDRNAANARIHRIGKGKINNARLAAKIDRRFGALIGEFHQAGATPARQNIGHGGA